MKDLKYLVAYSIPVAAIIGLVLRSYWTYFTPVFAFVLVPILEIIMPQDPNNLSEVEATSRAKNLFFDILLYLNLPLVYGILLWFLWSISWAEYNTSELIGLTFSIGIVLGSNGINVAHELGHRTTQWEKALGKLLLLPALYMHFYIEHNFGHHQKAATKEDPASAKYNQSVYTFWVTSIIRQYGSAWKLQMGLLAREKRAFFSLKNDMFLYLLLQGSYLVLVLFFFGSTALWIAIIIGFTGALLLETINYIEHYGLSRSKTQTGRYERMQEIHSWNSNHVLGRLMLYELTRHSDHHYRAHKKYQLLDCHESSPQMPFGYPTSMVISLLPPLWFAVMNKRIPEYMK
ncbi:MAG: alkane 1-monooxygenase [Altibacter sp.]|uniref:alkane 1-monooxygenase n=1 Tax=Altibacter sp. TaxID=2024823 RepID=UPI001D72C117|nr:alkane 1-monooxygenase [Altibacter sp.]MBZ0326572.1 alkane 1-monooxygenase [Altibacter sp.]